MDDALALLAASTGESGTAALEMEDENGKRNAAVFNISNTAAFHVKNTCLPASLFLPVYVSVSLSVFDRTLIKGLDKSKRVAKFQLLCQVVLTNSSITTLLLVFPFLSFAYAALPPFSQGQRRSRR